EFWKLLSNGNLAYDGKASLVDEQGNTILSLRDLGLTNEGQIESALVKILGFSLSDKSAVSLVQNMMAASGLVHSYNDDPDKWYWKGEYRAEVIGDNGISNISDIDLTAYNMNRVIDLFSINRMYNSYSDYRDNTFAVNKFINNVYGSPVGLLNYSYGIDAWCLLTQVYNPVELKMINSNYSWLKEAMLNGANIEGMIAGNVRITGEFGINEGIFGLNTSSVPGAKFFEEQHTGLDFAGRGSSITTPGGYWEFTQGVGHSAYFQLFGSDLKLRIMHLNDNDVKQLRAGTIFGGSNSTIINYPTASFGSGTGTHVHIDMTMRLPYNNYYTRQFVNPMTLTQGNQLNYFYKYYDANKNLIPDKSGNFNRY
ncbi:MAG: hypothetical protein LBH42_08710, partial [Treponema sp.]|nr:hypothetical protein [Treponema sp.]